MGVRWIVALLTVAALGAPASSSAMTTCSMKGPAWTLYAAHSNTAHHGSTYRVIANRVGCDTAKSYIKRMFAKNRSWPYARSPATNLKLKGAPSGYRCQSTVESERNRKEYAGSCLGGSGPSDIKRFAWAPKLPPL